MIQEAHIMGFDILQAGQICPRSEPTQFLYEMAALANGFSYLPPEGGMTGPELATPADILTNFNPGQIGDTPQIDFVRIPGAPAGLYLVVRPRHKAPAEQFEHLKPSKAPYYFLHRPAPLGYLETPKTILGAAAGQPVLSPGYPTCNIYALAKKGLPTSTKLENKHLKAVLAPLDPDRVPLIQALESARVKSDISQDGNLTFENTRISPT
jgi:predicted homoserine dehydrogenase-like protein